MRLQDRSETGGRRVIRVQMSRLVRATRRKMCVTCVCTFFRVVLCCVVCPLSPTPCHAAHTPHRPAPRHTPAALDSLHHFFQTGGIHTDTRTDTEGLTHTRGGQGGTHSLTNCGHFVCNYVICVIPSAVCLSVCLSVCLPWVVLAAHVHGLAAALHSFHGWMDRFLSLFHQALQTTDHIMLAGTDH